MAILGNLILNLGASTSGFLGGLNRADNAVAKFKNRMDSGGAMGSFFSGGTGRLGASIALAQTGMGLALNAASRAGSSIVGAIESASNLNETLSKTGIIFGPAADTITSKAAELSNAFGVNKDEYITAAGNFGAVFKGVGQSQADAAKLGNTLAQLGMDMAAFDNTSNAEAFTAISSALRGEFDPIEKYRVFLSAAKIEEEALAMGLAKSKGAIDEHAKKMATLSLIQKGTADAAGNLALTAGEPASQFRMLNGAIENLSTSFGQALLPAVSMGTRLLTSSVGSISTVFDQIKGPLEGFATGTMSVIEGTVLPGFANLGAGISTYLGMIPGAISEAIGPTAVGMITEFASNVQTFVLDKLDLLGFAWRNAADFGQIAFLKITEGVINLGEYFSVLPQNLGIIGEWISNNWSNLVIDGVNAVGSVFQNLGANIGNLFVAIQDFMAGKGFHFDWTPLLTDFEATSAQLPELLTPQLTSLQSQIDEKIGAIGAREAERSIALNAAIRTPAALTGPAAAVADQAGKLGNTPEYRGVAALDFGSTGASSAITRFRNQGSADDKPIKSVAAESKTQTALQQRMVTATEKIAANLGQSQGLQAFSLG